MDYWRHQVFCLVTHRYKKGELVENEEVQNVSDIGDFPAYDAEAIETKWQRVWEEQNLYKTEEDSSRPKKYVLEMFPYPSGDLHMGHARNYTIGDAMARQARMRGFDVLHPMGFDAFGLPAENAAIKHNTQPSVWTHKNIDQAVKTMFRMGFAYDKDRMFNTCDPEYYKWGQWIFLKMLEKGLVYRATSPVNWCPNDKTVLANEQVVNTVSAGAVVRFQRSVSSLSGTCASLITRRSFLMTLTSLRAGQSVFVLCRLTGLDAPRAQKLTLPWQIPMVSHQPILR